MSKITYSFLLSFCLVIFAGCQTAKLQEIKDEQKSVIENKSRQPKQTETEKPEEKAIRFAEDFIKKNGYTNELADRENLSHETVEFSKNIDELLEKRFNSLEPKAYGVLSEGKGSKKGWTVVFRYNKEKVSNEDYENLGRAVIMDEKFEKLLVEHKDFILKYAEKKLLIENSK